MKKILLILLLLTPVFSQVNFEPVTSSVYNYLERLSITGAIDINEEIMPFSRIYIAGKLIEIDGKRESLSSIEKDELDFYIREFSSELKRLGFDLAKYEAEGNKIIDLGSDTFGFDKYNRFRLVSYEDNLFGLFVDPVAGYSLEMTEGEKSTLWTNGLRMYGHIGESFGYELQFNDNHYGGDYFDNTRAFSPLTGYEFNVRKDFDRASASITFSWDWGHISLGKDFNYYGSGETGKLILSDKAPSFPNIKLEVNPVEWLRFSYIHGYLNSHISDSSTFRGGLLRDHISNVEKYFVAHLISVNPVKSLNISIGESVVYSDRFEPVYLIPVMFFRIADHYLTDPDENAGNAQLFGSFWYKNSAIKTKFYGSLFVDELSLSNSEYPAALGYNAGIKTVNPLIPESEITVEYTKIQPFVYFHADEAQTYENYGYQMGHWIGSNADQIYAAFNKKIIRGLNAGLSYSYIRKGQEESFEEKRYQTKHTFLWGLKNYYTEYGLNIEYEVIHSLYAGAEYRYIKHKKEITNGSFVTENKSFFSFGLKYGIN